MNDYFSFTESAHLDPIRLQVIIVFYVIQGEFEGRLKKSFEFGEKIAVSGLLAKFRFQNNRDVLEVSLIFW